MSVFHLVSPPPKEEDILLQVVDAATQFGGSPEACLLLRLTDGRVKVLSLAGQKTETLLNQLVRRYGPIEAAYAIEPGSRLRVRDLLHGRSWLHCTEGWAYDESHDQPCFATGLSRNAAIFAASLGMSTGALPNVETILSPPGVFN